MSYLDRPVSRPPQIHGPQIADMCRRGSMASERKAQFTFNKINSQK